jgi:hypothetical protein
LRILAQAYAITEVVFTHNTYGMPQVGSARLTIGRVYAQQGRVQQGLRKCVQDEGTDRKQELLRVYGVFVFALPGVAGCCFGTVDWLGVACV